MNAGTRNRLLIAGLALLTGLLFWFAPGDEDISLPSEKTGRHAGVQPGAIAVPSQSATADGHASSGGALKSELRQKSETVPDVFRSISWYVPPPPPPPPRPAPPPAPTAPPLPFVFLGQYADSGKQLFILQRGNRVLNVSIGEVIANTYRVDAFNGREVEFTYLPLDIKQSLPAGSN